MARKNTIWAQSLLAVLTSLLFAGSFVAGKYTTSEMSPLMITLLRYAIASLFLQGLVWYQSKQDKPPKISIQKASLSGVVATILNRRHTLIPSSR